MLVHVMVNLSATITLKPSNKNTNWTPTQVSEAKKTETKLSKKAEVPNHHQLASKANRKTSTD